MNPQNSKGQTLTIKDASLYGKARTLRVIFEAGGNLPKSEEKVTKKHIAKAILGNKQHSKATCFLAESILSPVVETAPDGTQQDTLNRIQSTVSAENASVRQQWKDRLLRQAGLTQFANYITV